MKTDSDFIQKLGGPSAVARMCNVTRSAVTQWKTDGIPDARRMYLELLHPKVFADKVLA